MENYSKEERYLRAKKRVDSLKGFYGHFASYVIVNTFISILKISSDLSEGKTFSESFFEFGTFAVWLFWGIGIFFHAFGLFGKQYLFGEKWEDKKIAKFMKEAEKQESKWS